MPAGSRLSPVIQDLIDKGLFDRLPPTFSTFFFEQFRDWHLLFPAERDYLERLFTLLDRSDPAAVKSVFDPLREVERKMKVDEKTWPRRQFGLAQVDFLNHSPYYGEWRRTISVAFSRVDPLLDAEVARKGKPALVIVTAPAELTTDPDRMWLRLPRRGKRVALEVPDGADYLNEIITGGSAKSILGLYSKNPYDSWAISANRPLNALQDTIRISYDSLKSYRLRLMEEVRRILESGEARTPRELNERLKRLSIHTSEGEFATDEVLSEFVRAVFLAGNGTLLINNTFVEWTTLQAIRRARPSVMIISFGIRNKLKPFSSMLIYTDQETASPIPSQMDVLGTSVDLEIFYQYIWQEFEKYPQYRNNTGYLFIADGMDELFCIGPSDFPLLATKSPVRLSDVFAYSKEWLNL
jgi:hypothetical protein